MKNHHVILILVVIVLVYVFRKNVGALLTQVGAAGAGAWLAGLAV